MVPFAKERASTNMAIDPICEMTVDPSRTPFNSEYQGRKVYFCCASCKKTFDGDPVAHMLPSGTE
jgi:YHS domain-containing protein